MKASYNWDYEWVSSIDPQRVSIGSSKFCFFNTDQKQGYTKVKVHIRAKHISQQIKMFYNRSNINNINMKLYYPENEQPIKFDEQEIFENVQKKVRTSTDLISQSNWVEKYAPRNYIDLLSQEYHNRMVLTWAKHWDKVVFKEKAQQRENNRKIVNFMVAVEEDLKNELDENRLILLAGPPGCGKTTLARVVAKHCGYKYVEINGSDTRSAKELIRKIDDMANNQSISDKPTFIIIDEVDGILDNEANGIGEILNYIYTGEIPGEKIKKDKKKGNQQQKGKDKKSNILFTKRPIIFICNDPFVKGLKQLRKKCYTVYMQKIRTEIIVEKLKSICDNEGITVERQALLKIASLNSNDIRGSMAMLQFLKNHRQFSYKSTIKIINSIEWDIKDSSKSPVDFIQRLMQLSSNKRDNTFQSFCNQYSDVQSLPLVTLLTLFHNLKNSKPFQRFTTKIPELFDIISQSDISINTSFGNEATMTDIFAIPYYHYKLQFKAEDNNTRIQFPILFFQRLSKQRQHFRRLLSLWESMNNSLKMFYSLDSLRYSLKTLYISIQSVRANQKQLLRCLKIMIMYGIKFEEGENEMYSPPLESMIKTNMQNVPKRILSGVSKGLMKSNYNNVKESVDSMNQDVKPMLWKVMNENKRRGEGIEYKFKEGTGTEVKDIIKMSYFL